MLTHAFTRAKANLANLDRPIDLFIALLEFFYMYFDVLMLVVMRMLLLVASCGMSESEAGKPSEHVVQHPTRDIVGILSNNASHRS